MDIKVIKMVITEAIEVGRSFGGALEEEEKITLLISKRKMLALTVDIGNKDTI